MHDARKGRGFSVRATTGIPALSPLAPEGKIGAAFVSQPRGICRILHFYLREGLGGRM